MRSTLVAAGAALLVAVAPVRADAPPGFLLTWGTPGSGPGQFNRPAGVAVDASGNVYVADTENHRVQKFTSNGVFLLQWGELGSGDGSFNSPSGIAVDQTGNVYVTDGYNGKVQKFTTDGAFILSWSSPAYGITVDDAGNVYVGGSSSGRVYTSTGQFLRTFGTYGLLGEPGTFYSMQGLAHRDGVIYACNTGAFGSTHYIEKFSTEGAYLGRVSMPNHSPTFAAFDAFGYLYVTEWLTDWVQSWFPEELAVGEQGTGNGQFQGPVGIAVDAQRNIYVSDALLNRIQKFGTAVTPTARTTWGSIKSLYR